MSDRVTTLNVTQGRLLPREEHLVGMQHSVQDESDAARRHRLDSRKRPKPIRYDIDTWLIMRGDPVLPAAIITRQHTADGHEYFRVVTWDLDPAERLLVGRRGSLLEADALVLHKHPDPVTPHPDETSSQVRERREEAERAALADLRHREALYGPTHAAASVTERD
jgi:hypothetical protein